MHSVRERYAENAAKEVWECDGVRCTAQYGICANCTLQYGTVQYGTVQYDRILLYVQYVYCTAYVRSTCVALRGSVTRREQGGKLLYSTTVVPYRCTVQYSRPTCCGPPPASRVPPDQHGLRPRAGGWVGAARRKGRASRRRRKGVGPPPRPPVCTTASVAIHAPPLVAGLRTCWRGMLCVVRGRARDAAGGRGQALA